MYAVHFETGWRVESWRVYKCLELRVAERCTCAPGASDPASQHCQVYIATSQFTLSDEAHNIVKSIKPVHLIGRDSKHCQVYVASLPSWTRLTTSRYLHHNFSVHKWCDWRDKNKMISLLLISASLLGFLVVVRYLRRNYGQVGNQVKVGQ